MKRILILMSKTGGGHLASAKALKEAFEARPQEQFEVEIIDFLADYLSFPINRIPRAYDVVVNRAPTFWRLLWNTMASPRISEAAARTVIISARRQIENLIRTKRPNLVLSVHPLVNHVFIPILKRVSPSTPYITVVTDLESVHPLWLHPDATATFVPSEKIAAAAVLRGIDRQQVHALGLPVRNEFSEPKPDRRTLRQTFGLSPDLAAILVIGGGSGVGGLTAIVEHIADATSKRQDHLPVQLVVVCGNNAPLRNILSNRRWPIPVAVLGFTNRMSDLMHACDLIVTKAGPGTIAEATICGLPIILSGFIPGQEEGNVRLVIENYAGLYLPNPTQIAATVTRLLGPDRSILDMMRSRSKTLGKPEATGEIVRTITELMRWQEPKCVA